MHTRLHYQLYFTGSGSTSETGSIGSSGHLLVQDENNNTRKRSIMDNHAHTVTLPTMESIARNIRLLLDGKPFEEMYEFCDYSLEDQNETSLAKGIQPSAPSDFKPVIKKSVTYIVAAVLINEHGDVLMMQVISPFKIKIIILFVVQNLIFISNQF